MKNLSQSLVLMFWANVWLRTLLLDIFVYNAIKRRIFNDELLSQGDQVHKQDSEHNLYTDNQP